MPMVVLLSGKSTITSCTFACTLLSVAFNPLIFRKFYFLKLIMIPRPVIQVLVGPPQVKSACEKLQALFLFLKIHQTQLVIH